MLVYGAAAGIVLLLIHRPSWWILSMVVAIISARWAQTLAESLGTFPDLAALTGSMDPDRPEIEVGRETLGLLIVTVSLLAVGMRAWRRAALDIDGEDGSKRPDPGAGDAPLPLTEDEDGGMNAPHPAGEDHDRPDDRAEDA